MENTVSKVSAICELEDRVARELALSTTDITNETGIVGYEWSETFNDLKSLGIDTTELGKDTSFYGYNFETNEEATYDEYIHALCELLVKEGLEVENSNISFVDGVYKCC